jgi:hypothetical protein
MVLDTYLNALLLQIDKNHGNITIYTQRLSDPELG